MIRTTGMGTAVFGLLLSAAPYDASYAQTGRSIALVLDASGSMNAKLPDGATRIDAAKSAVADLVGRLPADTRLALRAYGHQSPTQHKNCQDTALLVGFDAVANNKSAVLAASRSIRAQGYTPITYALKLAAEDLGKENAATRVVVLVSDGKETCAGDPCATAKALADADAKLVVHTVGLGVDAAARFQLKCIASVARGLYTDAGSGGELMSALGRAAQAEAVQPKKEVVVAKTLGKIRIEGATAYTHDVIDAAAGQKITAISAVWPEREVPPGIYTVKFDNGKWQGVEVKPGETVVLKPGLLEIRGADLWGHKLLDPETSETIGQFVAHKTRIPLLPTRFLVTFSKAVWPELVEIREGATTKLNPGVLKVSSTKPFKATVNGDDGREIAEVSSAISRIALPPGRYTLEAAGQKFSVELKEGQDVEMKIP